MKVLAVVVLCLLAPLSTSATPVLPSTVMSSAVDVASFPRSSADEHLSLNFVIVTPAVQPTFLIEGLTPEAIAQRFVTPETTKPSALASTATAGTPEDSGFNHEPPVQSDQPRPWSMPEPATLVLMGVGLAALVGVRSKIRRYRRNGVG